MVQRNDLKSLRVLGVLDREIKINLKPAINMLLTCMFKTRKRWQYTRMIKFLFSVENND